MVLGKKNHFVNLVELVSQYFEKSGLRFEHEAKIKLIACFKNLKMLEVENGTDIQRFGNFSEHKKLEKIYIRYTGRYIFMCPLHQAHQEFGSWGKATRSLFNPKLSLNPRVIENVLELRIFPSEIPQNLEMKQIAEKMKNLESLEIFGQILDLAEIGQFISSFTNLKKVRFCHAHGVPLQGKVFMYKSFFGET